MTRGARALGVVIGVVALCTSAAPVRADDRTRADRLFEDGKALVERGQYAEACRDFEASAAIDPGIGTRLWLADCYESQGRYASARVLFQTVLADALRMKDRRASIADGRARALDRKVAFYVVRTTDAAPAETLECDGTPFRPDDGPLAVDPGRHVLVAHAPGRDVWETSFTATAGSTSDLVVPALGAQREVTSRDAAAPVLAAKGSDAVSWKTWGLVGGGAGIASLATSAVLTALAVHDHDQSSSDGCTPARCTQAGYDDEERARTLGNAATGTLVTGGVLVAAGVALYLLAPSTRSAPPVSAGAGGLVAHF